MKKLLAFIMISLSIQNMSYAYSVNHSSYYDQGYIYSNSSFPQSVATQNTCNTDLSTLKRGVSTARKYFTLIEVGNAGINEAIRNGQIKKVCFVDTKVDKVFVPYFFIPVSVKQTKTIVYGE